MGKLLVLLYGIACYLIFFATFLYAVGFVADLGVPRTVDSGPAAPVPQALAIDLVLLSVFAIQHSVMARRGFKQWWTKIVPEPVERSTFVLAASLALDLLYWQWRPIAGTVWQTTNPQLATTLAALAFFGWFLVLTATFLISHFELFGLSQVYRYFTGAPAPEPRFRSPLYYRLVRHPIYLGFVLAFWATPVMTLGHALFAVMTSVYMLIGIMFEERDLLHVFGEEYRRYRQRVPMLLPWRRPL